MWVESREQKKALLYLMGWFETHPEEFPQSYGEMLDKVVKNDLSIL